MELRRALESLIESEPFGRLLLERARPVLAHAETAEDAVVAGLSLALETPVMGIAAGPREAEALADGVEAYLGPDRVALLPAWEALPYEGISPPPEIAARRADAVARLRLASGPFVLVAPALSAMQGLIPTLGLLPALRLELDQELSPLDLAERLVGLGYSRTDVVEHRGEFAVRGGVVDVFPGIARRPVRVEYFGDQIESLREFVPSSQLSTERVRSVDVPTVQELIADEAVRKRAEVESHKHGDRLADMLGRFAEGLSVEGSGSLAPLLFDHLPPPAELLPKGAWVAIVQAEKAIDRAHQAWQEADALAQAISWPGPPALLPLEEALGDRVQLRLSSFNQGIDLGIHGWGTARGNPAELAAKLRDLDSKGYDLIVSARAHGSLERAAEIIGKARLTTVGSGLREGFVLEAAKLAVATEEDLFGARRHTRAAPRFTKRKSDSVADELTREITRFTGSTASVAMPASSIGSWPEPSVTTWSWSMPRRTGCSSPAIRWGWSPDIWAAIRRGFIAWGEAIGRVPRLGSSGQFAIWRANWFVYTACAWQCRATRSVPTLRGSASWRTPSRSPRPGTS